MSDDLQRRGLLADLTRHLAPLSHDALRILDEFAMALLQVERERPIVLESLARQIVRFDPREPERLAIQAAIQLIGHRLREEDGERAERHEQARDEIVPGRPPAVDRYCKAMQDTADAIRADRELRADRERRTADVQIGRPGDNWGGDPIVVDDPDAAREFRADRLTEISPVPAAIARTMTPTLDEDPDPYDSLELEWDVSDIHAGEGT